MSPRVRTILLSLVALAVVAGVGVGGYVIISQRADGSGRAAIPAVSPSPAPSVSASPSLPPPRKHWLVAMLRREVPVRVKPEGDAKVIRYLKPKTPFGVETVCLVREVVETPQRVWYHVWLPTAPNGSHGHIAEGGVTLYPVYTRIVIDLSDRVLSVVDGDDAVKATFPVAVGKPGTLTPTGRFFVTEKIKPQDTSTAYGVFAMALSAYSPTLAGTPAWGDGQVAIHGTNQPQLIGQAISNGCVRMKNADILSLHKLVSTGSPVTIKR